MPTATKLGSGQWRCQFYIDGKRRSVTRATKKEAEYAALEMTLKQKHENSNITVGKAIDDYISMKDGVLSPSTIAGYKKIRKNNLKTLMPLPIDALTRPIVQAAINEESKKLVRGKPMSAKSIHNSWGLVSAACSMADEDFAIKVTLPPNQKKLRDLPSVEDVIRVILGTDIELPCLLAMWMSFTASEIKGIEASSITPDGTVKIMQTVVRGEDGEVLRADTKEYERTRQAQLPPYLFDMVKQTDAWKAGSGRICPSAEHTWYNRLQTILKNAGMRPLRFHDLRHLNASVMLLLGIPEKYALERGGWATPNVMKSVYQHTFSAERIEVDNRINHFFDEIIAHENAHDSENT